MLFPFTLLRIRWNSSLSVQFCLVSCHSWRRTECAPNASLIRIYLRSEGVQLVQNLCNHDPHEVAWLVLHLGRYQQCVAHEHEHPCCDPCDDNAIHSESVYQSYTSVTLMSQDRSTVRTNVVMLRSAKGYNTSNTTPGTRKRSELQTAVADVF